MSIEPQVWRCPRDGEAMQAMGRRAGAWRCPTCRGVFLDVQVMRSRPEEVPKWAPVVVSVAMSVLATVVARLIRRRRSSQAKAAEETVAPDVA